MRRNPVLVSDSVEDCKISSHALYTELSNVFFKIIGIIKENSCVIFYTEV